MGVWTLLGADLESADVHGREKTKDRLHVSTPR